MISAYANEKSDYISPAELKGIDFFYTYTDRDATIHSLDLRIWHYPGTRLAWELLDIDTTCTTSEQNHYFLLGERDIDTRIFLGGDIDVSAAELKEILGASCRAKVYSSQGFALYK